MAPLERRRLLIGAAALVAAPAARADTFPNGPIRILVPFGPGSATDQAARNIGDGLNRQFGVPVVVENKPGANGAIAAEIAAKSKPDGQTIFVCSNTAAASNVALMKSIPYDPLRDFDPLTIIGKAPVFMMVNPKIDAKTAQEFVALAKRQPGKINFGSGSASTRISGELLKAKGATPVARLRWPQEMTRDWSRAPPASNALRTPAARRHPPAAPCRSRPGRPRLFRARSRDGRCAATGAGSARPTAR